MKIEITKEQSVSFIKKVLNWLKWPLTVIVFGIVISPGFWKYWNHRNINSILILNYINALKWPIIVIFIFLAIRKYIPNILDRIEEVTFAKLGVKLKPAENKIDPKDVPESVENIEPATTNVEGVEANEEEINNQLSSPDAIAFFQIVNNNIYGSQILILKRLANYVPAGRESSQLLDLYRAHTKAAKSSGTLPYSSFEALVQFLIDTNLVVLDGDDNKYKITYAGLYFLKYLQDNNIYHILPPN